VQDYPDAAKFASELFGEPFEWQTGDPNRQDVAEAAHIPPAALGPVWGQGAPELYPALEAALHALDPLAALPAAAEAHRLPAESIAEARQAAKRFATPAGAISACLYALLRGDRRLRRLQEALLQSPCFLNALSRSVLHKKGIG
jgi:hypothetical protein